MHLVHRCGPLLQMSIYNVFLSVCLSVCLLVTTVSPVKMAEMIKMLFWVSTQFALGTIII